MGGVAVIVAVKALPVAKSRLATQYPPDARRRLVLAMLVDTLAAARDVAAVASITVITPDADVVAPAAALGTRVLHDPTPPAHPDPLNHAVGVAEAAIGATDVVALQGDLPALRSRELAEAIAAGRRHGRSFVADHHGTGTVALLAFGEPLRPRFGPASASRHRRSGAVELRQGWPGLRCDIDVADDLVRASALGVGEATTAVLAEEGRGGSPVRRSCGRLGR